MNKKGQGVAIDFLFAVMIFLLILNASMILINSNNEIAVDKNLIGGLQSSASQAIDTLVRTEGMPTDWQNKSMGEVTSIGLAKRDRVLDNDKVNTFVTWAKDYSDETGDYNKVKILLLSGYDFHFKIVNSSGATLKEAPNQNKPINPGSWDNMTAVRIKRIVNFNGEEAIAEFTIYYPQ